MKRIVTMLLLIFVLTAAGCGRKEETSDAPIPVWETIPEQVPAVAGVSKPQVDQERIIIEHQGMWKPHLDYANDYMAFSITDLDGNGRKEVISSQQGGSGNYTYSRIYEVTEEMDGLAEIGEALGALASQPDLIDDRWDCYYDASQDVTYYIVSDLMKNGPAQYSETTYAMHLKDGVLAVTPLAVKTQTYSEKDGPVCRCEDAQGAPITEEDYREIAQSSFPGCERKSIVLHWTRMQ